MLSSGSFGVNFPAAIKVAACTRLRPSGEGVPLPLSPGFPEVRPAPSRGGCSSPGTQPHRCEGSCSSSGEDGGVEVTEELRFPN